MICLLWIHNINLHLARSKLQLPGTALVISLNRHSGWPFPHQMCLSTGMPADWASSSGQDFRSPRDMWLVLVQSICIKSPVFQHPKSQKISCFSTFAKSSHSRSYLTSTLSKRYKQVASLKMAPECHNHLV